ncbi:hypothetical protein ACFYZB_43510 [Streptomyces sp. NPDC001852]|uniref:hypothetical protein n=1 Tax=Streptomyces sp. NPDC001852 TaxID=3364619 RepID=UPI0036A7B949
MELFVPFPRRRSGRRCASTALLVLRRSSLFGDTRVGLCVFAAAAPAEAVVIRASEWPLTQFQADEIWHASQGQGITVVVVDTGVDAAHPDLKGAEAILERAT